MKLNRVKSGVFLIASVVCIVSNKSFADSGYELFPLTRKAFQTVVSFDHRSVWGEGNEAGGYLVGGVFTGVVGVFDAVVVHPLMLVDASLMLISQKRELAASRARLERVREAFDKESNDDHGLRTVDRHESTSISTELLEETTSQEAKGKKH